MADYDHLHPVFRERVLATGVGLISGARSHARQRQLYECWLAREPGCNPANPPGSSWHEYDEQAAFPYPDSEASPLVGGAWAMAVDFDEPYPHGAEGLCFPIGKEPWHAQPSEITETARVAGAWRRLPPAEPSRPPDPPDPWAGLFIPILISHRRLTMQRFPAVKRPGGVTIAAKKHDCYDLHGCWEDGRTFAGVVHSSTAQASLVTEPAKPVKVRVYGSGRDQDLDLAWGDTLKVTIGATGLVSFVPLETGVELDAWWELVAGKA